MSDENPLLVHRCSLQIGSSDREKINKLSENQFYSIWDLCESRPKGPTLQCLHHPGSQHVNISSCREDKSTGAIATRNGSTCRGYPKVTKPQRTHSQGSNSNHLLRLLLSKKKKWVLISSVPKFLVHLFLHNYKVSTSSSKKTPLCTGTTQTEIVFKTSSFNLDLQHPKTRTALIAALSTMFWHPSEGLEYTTVVE